MPPLPPRPPDGGFPPITRPPHVVVPVSMLGSEQQLLPNTRRHYQPNAATFERRSIPPAFVRRISRPTAERNTAGSCNAGGMRTHKVLVTGHRFVAWISELVTAAG